MEETTEKELITCTYCNHEAETMETKGNGNDKETICPDCYDAYIECNNCGKVESEDRCRSHENETYCESCADELLGHCETCENTCLAADMEHADDKWLCESCYQDNYTKCTHCHDAVHTDLSYSPNSGHDTYCESCYSDNFSTCEECDETMPNNDGNYTADGFYCNDCDTIKNKFTESDAYIFNKFPSFVGYELEFVSDTTPSIDALGTIKADGSVSANENQSGKSPHEFASIAQNGDELLRSIKKVCSSIISNGGEINKTCGFHVHIDMRDKTTEQKTNVYYAFQAFESIFLGMVSTSRRTNTYCKPIHGVSYSAANNDRYKTLNICSLREHGTFEYRLHQGTLDAEKVQNWILLLLNFTSTFSLITLDGSRLIEIDRMTAREKLLLLFSVTKIPLSLKKYMVSRIKELGKNYISLKHHDARQLGLNLQDYPINNVIDANSNTSDLPF